MGVVWGVKGKESISPHIYFFFPLLLLLFECVDTTLEALEGAADVALLPPTDLTLSRALFYSMT